MIENNTASNIPFSPLPRIILANPMDSSARDNPSGPAIPINKNIIYILARDTSSNTKILVEIEDSEYSRDNNNHNNNYNPPRKLY
jgi:hypothetical protein